MAEITPHAPAQGNGLSIVNRDELDEKTAIFTDKDESKVTTAPFSSFKDGIESERGSEDVIIVSGADAAAHLLPMRDDGDPAVSFRSILLASSLSCFQAVMNQIYMVSQRTSDILFDLRRHCL